MSMCKYLLAVVVLTVGLKGHAAPGVGLNVGVGFPFLGQAGLNYRLSDRVGFSLGYNYISLDAGLAKAKMAMPELLLHFHPFAGSFFVAGGVGQETLETTATDTMTTNKVTIDIKAMTTIAKAGWMWGIKNGGFWLGFDVAYIMPNSPESTITATGVPPTSQTYKDAVELADKYGETSYTNITFLRLGYLF